MMKVFVNILAITGTSCVIGAMFFSATHQYALAAIIYLTAFLIKKLN